MSDILCFGEQYEVRNLFIHLIKLMGAIPINRNKILVDILKSSYFLIADIASLKEK